MNSPDREEGMIDDRLVKSLLMQADRENLSRISDLDVHPDEETLTLFVEGGLLDEERQETILHLSNCPDCRQTVSLLMKLEESIPLAAPKEEPHILKFRPFLSMLAMAASIIVVIGIVFLLPEQGGQQLLTENEAYKTARELLIDGKFSEAKKVISSADQITSDRLRSLESQIAREIPGPIALASLGQLTDFGYEIDGVIIRDPEAESDNKQLKSAQEILSKAGEKEYEVLLNRGHLMLKTGEPEKALSEFQKATGINPEDPLGWLGTGIAHYMLNDYESAVKDFRKSLQLDPDNTSTKINLAMTLTEQGKLDEALSLWKELDTKPLPEKDLEKIRQQIQEIEQLNQK